MSVSLTKTTAGVLMQETGQPDLLFETKLSSLTEGANAVTIDGMVNKKWTRKDIPNTGLTIDGVAFTGTPIELVKKLRDDVFNGTTVTNNNGSVDMSDYFTKAEVAALFQNVITL